VKLTDIKALHEGGAAMKGKNVVRINKNDIPATIKYVSKVSGIPVSDMYPLGSVGKQDTSGDIDLAIDVRKHDAKSAHAKMVKALGDDAGTYNPGTKVGSYAVPIKGTSDDMVQVDFMFVENPTWAQFAYFSAGDKSKYKGQIRNLLLAGVAATMNEKGKDVFHYDGDELIVRVGRGIDMNVGLKRLFQMRPKKKSGEGYVKAFKRVTPEEIKKAYPDLEFEGSNMVIDDPQEAVTMMFGKGVKPSNVDTAEEVLALIKKMPKDRQELILKVAKNRARELQGKTPLPPELTS
jgi:hypothetical protein